MININWRVVVSCLVLTASTGHAQLADGLYAVFHTDFGSFTARLDYVEAPVTVGNFVGLVEGTQSWIEEATGIPRNDPYYDGIIVNRIADIPERIIQTGSQNGTNSGGGPGYTFRDEFHPNLRHDEAGILSMANSGPDSNGSQIFFTLGPLPGLDDVHNVFGQVIDGLDVLTAIGDVPLSGSKPVDDVIFHQVEIVRIGAAAMAYDASAQGLPVVTGLKIGILPEDSDHVLITYDTNIYSELKLYCSPELSQTTEWNEVLTQWHLDNHPSPQITLLVTNEAEFFSVARVDYQEVLYTPFDLSGFRVRDTNDEIDVRLSLLEDEGFVQVVQGGFSSFLDSWDWTPGPYRGTLAIRYSGFTPPQTSMALVFTNSLSGFYTAEVRNGDGSVSFTFDGEFTVSSYEQADLSIAKTSLQPSVVAGASITYTLDVRNAGPSNATDVVVFDFLPPGASFNTSGSSPECVAMGNDRVECELGTIPDGDTIVLTVRVDAVSSAVGALTNIAEVAASSDDILREDNRSTNVTPVEAEADLQFTLQDSVDPVNPGHGLTYTMTVSNAGPSDAEGVMVSNALPTAVSFLDNSPSATDIVLRLHLDEAVGATLFADDSGLANDGTCVGDACPTAEIPYLFGSALRFDGVDDRLTISDGSTLSFGNGSADSPFTMSAWVNPVDATTFPIISKSIAGGSVNREYLFSFDTADRLEMVLYTKRTARRIGRRSNQAYTNFEGSWHHVTATYDGSGTEAGITLYVDGIEVSSTPTSFGDYVAMSNLGIDCTIGSCVFNDTFANGAMDEVIVHDRALSAHEIADLFSDGPLRCTESAGIVTCGPFLLAAGQTSLFTVDGTVDPGATGILTATAGVSSSTTDPLPAGNTAVEETAVAEADLQILLEDSVDPVDLGQGLTYTITVSNAGPHDAEGLMVSNDLPSAVNFLGASANTYDIELLLNLEESGGATTFQDDSGSGNNGTCSGGGCPTSGVAGRFGSAASFDGVDDRITIPDGGTLSFGNGATDSPATLSAWVNAADVTRFRIMGKSRSGGGADREFLLTFDGEDRLSMFLYDDGTADNLRRQSDLAYTGLEGGWHHVAATYDGSGTSTGITLYVDGIAISSAPTAVGNYLAMSNLGIDLTIGSWVAGNDFANGAMDQIIAHNRELSEGEIADMFENGIPDCTESAGVVTCGPFRLPAGQTLLLTVDGTVDPGASGILTATAGVSSSANDFLPGNNTAVEETSITAADLQIMLEDSVDPVGLGQILTYTMIVSNAGPQDAEDVVVSNDLPSAVSFLNAATITPDIALLMHLDESSGATTFRDTANPGNNGTCSGSGCPASGGAGPFGNAVSFDGIDDGITIPDGGALSFGNGMADSPFTMSAWINPVDITRFRIVSKSRTGGGADLEYVFTFDGEDRLSLFLYDEGTVNYLRRQSAPVYTGFEGSWHHVAVTYDGSGTAAGIALYVDGIVVSSVPTSVGSYVAMSDLGIDFSIGAWIAGNNFAHGAMDEVIVHDRVLSGSEIADLLSADCTESAGVVSCGPFTLPAGQTRLLTVDGTVDPGAGSLLTATANVSSSTTDPSPASNTAVEETTVIP